MGTMESKPLSVAARIRTMERGAVEKFDCTQQDTVIMTIQRMQRKYRREGTTWSQRLEGYDVIVTRTDKANDTL